MSSEHKYYDVLITDDLFSEKKLEDIQKLQPDLNTYIVNALETTQNPDSILLDRDEKQYLSELSFEDAVEHLHYMKYWIERTLCPSMHIMSNRNRRIGLKELKILANTIQNCIDIGQKTPRAIGRGVKDSNYRCVCQVCGDEIMITNDSYAFDDLRDHSHLTEAIANANLIRQEPKADVKDNADSSNASSSSSVLLKTDISRQSSSDVSLKNVISGQSSSTDSLKKDNSSPSCSSSSDQQTPSWGWNSMSEQQVNTSSSSCSSISDTDRSVSNQKAKKNKRAVHNSEILKKLYPIRLMTVLQRYELCLTEWSTIQKFSPENLLCLICNSVMRESSLPSHVSGQRHLNHLKNTSTIHKLGAYHGVIQRLPAALQIHQVILRPGQKFKVLQCIVCKIALKEYEIVPHLSSDKHQARLRNKTFTNYYFYNKLFTDKTSQTNEIEEKKSTNKIKSVEVTIKNQQIPDTSNLNHQNLPVPPKKKALLPTPKLPQQKIVPVIKSSTPTKSNEQQQQQNNKTSTPKQILKPSENLPQTSNGNDTVEKIALLQKHNILPAFSSNPSDLLDELELRFQIHRQFLQWIDGTINCVPCSVQLPAASVEEIKKHLIDTNHKALTKEKVNNKPYSYWCDLCCRKYHKEEKWIEHLLFIDHVNRLKERVKTSPYLEYECTSCRYVLFGNQNSIMLHRKMKVPRSKSKIKEVKLPVPLDNLMKTQEEFCEKIYQLLKESDDVLNEMALSSQCCKAIERALAPAFGNCRAYPFGSRISGLGNTKSDLDVFVDLGHMFDGLFFQDATSQTKFVNDTSVILHRHRDFRDINPIPQARTPIVQAYHRVTTLDCDLSFRHGLSVKNTDFLRLCICLQPNLRTLILFLKFWSDKCKLSTRITTYALSMLSIFYMQVKGYLPSVEKLRELDNNKPKIIGEWKTYSDNYPIDRLKPIVTECNLFTQDLVRDFYKYYSEFEYDKYIVCPLLGYVVLKSDFNDFDDGRLLPKEMGEYVYKINKSKDSERFRSMSAMCVQDPFDLSHNLTKACPLEQVNKFIICCKLSYTSISNIVTAANGE